MVGGDRKEVQERVKAEEEGRRRGRDSCKKGGAVKIHTLCILKASSTSTISTGVSKYWARTADYHAAAVKKKNDVGIYSRTSDTLLNKDNLQIVDNLNSPVRMCKLTSEIGTTSLQGTTERVSMCPFHSEAPLYHQ